MGLEDGQQQQKWSREEAEEPRDAKVVRSLLSSMGVERYEPRVVHQFLELWYGYIVDVLSDAQTYSEHPGKTSIDCDDVKHSIQSKANFSFCQPIPESWGHVSKEQAGFTVLVDNPCIS